MTRVASYACVVTSSVLAITGTAFAASGHLGTAAEMLGIGLCAALSAALLDSWSEP